jgi:Asp-tRNA(Asn)/Glu-tRNA(Gln) amidotransferase A subunit family amidase
MCADAMQSVGHTVYDVTPPAAASPYKGLLLSSQLINADGCKVFRSWFRPGEWNDPGADQLSFYARLPALLRYLHYAWVRYVRRDPLWAELLLGFREKTVPEQWALVSKREAFRAEWHRWWNEQEDLHGLDVILTPPNATPAVPHDGMRDAVSSCGYTFLFNLLDYSAGVLPVTHVDAAKDALPSSFDMQSLNGIAKGAYRLYDAHSMDGLPVGVQVVGRRLEEEKVLAVMGRIESILEDRGEDYRLMELD